MQGKTTFSPMEARGYFFLLKVLGCGLIPLVLRFEDEFADLARVIAYKSKSIKSDSSNYPTTRNKNLAVRRASN